MIHIVQPSRARVPKRLPSLSTHPPHCYIGLCLVLRLSYLFISLWVRHKLFSQLHFNFSHQSTTGLPTNRNPNPIPNANLRKFNQLLIHIRPTPKFHEKYSRNILSCANRQDRQTDMNT